MKTYLTLIRRIGIYKNYDQIWSCKCICGKITKVNLPEFKSGRTKSCGCFRASLLKTRGQSYTTTYKSYMNMLQRTTNSKHSKYKYYGGRGIRVCDRWLSSFVNFLEDMGHRPLGMSIDRINSDGNYEPSNCKWSTKQEQTQNQRHSNQYKKITWGNK